jgi:zinc transport system ATP-binding protein
MLAKALVSEPRIIILDEPVSGVDIKSSKEVYDILHNMNKEKGLAVLIITHELDKFSKYLNNVFNIDAGILNNAFMRNDVNWTVPGYDCISV